MDFENDYKKTERNYLCEFSIKTRIDDIDLPNKIKDKLNLLKVLPDSEKGYVLDTSFGAAIYKDDEFYKFPVERKQWQIDNLEKLKNKKDSRKIAETIIGEVLSQQLHNICEILGTFNINCHSATIAGEDIDDINRVDFCIYEDVYAAKELPSNSTNKSKRKVNKVITYSIIPHRPSTIKKLAEVLGKMVIEKSEKEYKKEQEKSKHTPNMKSADEIFTALATAILEERQNDRVSQEALFTELLSQAQVEDDWPLRIRGNAGALPNENGLTLDSQIDCPEYLVYVKRKGHWVLSKVANLEAAKFTILSCGYNQKSVEQVIVLHNLQNVRFKLFVENNGEIRPISKNEAYTAKKLLLSWC